MTLTSIIILAWLQLIISAPFQGIITFAFDNILAAATANNIEEQLKESRIGIIKHMRRMSNTITHGIRRMSNTNISSIASSITDVRRLSSSVRSTITVNPDFFKLRRSVIEILRDNTNDSIVAGGGGSNNVSGDNSISTTTNDTANDHDDTSSNDKSSIILARCNEFVNAFSSYRDSLNDDERNKFDDSWSFLFAANNNTTTIPSATSSSVTPYDPNDTVPSATSSSVTPYDPDDTDIRFMNMRKIVYSEIDKVYSQSCKVIGTTTTTTTTTTATSHTTTITNTTNTRID